MKRILLLSAACMLLCGCVATNLSEFQKSMAGDPATVVLDFNTIYGKLHLTRVGGGEAGVTKTISPDGTVIIKTN